MNICFLLGGFSGIGGIGRVVSILANELCEKPNIYVYTISLYDNGRKNNYEIDYKIVQNFLFEKPTNMKKAMIKGGALKLRKIIKENNIDILIACGALYYPIVVLSTIGLSTKAICWEHSNALNIKDHAFQSFSRWIGAIFSSCVVTLTKYDQKLYRSKYKNDRIEQIYNPIDQRILFYTKDYDIKSKKIISIGRFCYQKNFELLVEIAHEILTIHPDWKWEIYGDGETKETISRRIKQLGIENKLILKGSVNNLYQLYSNYSFLVMTSRYEGFPMSLLEGLANGLPMISFDILTGPNEIIVEKLNGFLISDFDTNNMINQINILIENTELRKNMSDASKRLSENFQLDKIISQWISLFLKYESNKGVK